MQTALPVARSLVAVVFAVAGLAKLADRGGLRWTLAEFGVPRALLPAGAWLLPLSELAVAAALVPVTTARAGAGVAAAMLAVFCAAIVRVLARGRRPDCGCFGRALASQVGPGTLTRNAILAGLATAIAAAGPGESLAGALARLDLPLTLLGLAAVAQVWLVWQLFRQNGRLLERVRSLEARDGVG
jgi:uncharacterized membrane protein YphA (DoxX/SURF4 family)